MSGGSLDYLYSRVDDAASTIRSRCDGPQYRAFADHLEKVAKALHDIEWWMSGDYGEEQARASLAAIIGPREVLDAALDYAREAYAELGRAIDSATEVER